MYMLVVKTKLSIHECDMRITATDSQLCNKLVHSHLGLRTLAFVILAIPSIGLHTVPMSLVVAEEDVVCDECEDCACD